MIQLIRKLFTRSPKKPVITSHLRRVIVHVNSDVISEVRISSRNNLGLANKPLELSTEPFSNINSFSERSHDSSCNMVLMANAVSSEVSHSSTIDHHSPSFSCDAGNNY